MPLLTVSESIWTDEIYGSAPGASKAGVDMALRNTLRDFCRASGAWVVELWDADEGGLRPFNQGSALPFYDFQAQLETERAAQQAHTPPDPIPGYTGGAAATAMAAQLPLADDWAWDVLYVQAVSYFDRFEPGVTTSATKRLTPTYSPLRRSPGSNPGQGQPAAYATYNERPGVVELLPPAAGNLADREGIVPWVSLGFPPVWIENAVPIVFQRYWYDTILSGSLLRLLGQQDKPYTNPQLALYHGKKYRNEIAVARDMAMRQFNTSERGWEYPRWA